MATRATEKDPLRPESPAAACVPEPTVRLSFEELEHHNSSKRLISQSFYENSNDSAISLISRMDRLSTSPIPAMDHNPGSPITALNGNEDMMYYYEGLRGLPKLLARTGQDTFVRKWEDGYTMRKCISNIGLHPLVGKMENGIWDAILNILCDTDWLHIDIVRIGYSSRADKNTPVVLISVTPNTISTEDAEAIVIQCQQFLFSKNITIDVEMKEGLPIEPLVNGQALQDIPVASIGCQLRSQYPPIGVGISPSFEKITDLFPGSMGSLGLYVNIDGDKSRTYAITCHHVAFPKCRSLPNNNTTHYIRKSGDILRFGIDQPPTRDHNDEMERLNNKIEPWVERLANIKERETLILYGARELLESEIQIKSDAEAVLSVWTPLLKSYQTFDRHFGNIFASSGIKVHPKNGNRLDWALVEIDTKRCDPSSLNKLPDLTGAEKEISLLFNNRPPPLWDAETSRTVTLIAPLEEILHPKYQPDKGDHSFRVAKFGAASNWTVGKVNEIKSMVRIRGADIVPTYSTELLVIAMQGREAFSMTGDSGALVVDISCRAVGMIHAGHQETDGGSDFTYVTPIEWLLESIQEQIGAKLFLPGA